MKILLTGSSGFIGKKIIKELEENHSFIKLDLEEGFDLTKWGDISNIKDFDICIHTAAKSYVPASFKEPQKFYFNNVNSTLNCLELCRINNAKMLYISSYVYGIPEYLPIDENHILKAFNPYAQTKIICEKLCEGYYRDFNIPCTILRPFNIYGPGQDKTFLLSKISDQIKSGRMRIELKNPRPRRDFVYINDVVAAIKLATFDLYSGSINYKTYNICSGKSYSVYEITKIIHSLDFQYRNIKFLFDEATRKNEVLETLGSYKKINHDLGWKPSITIKEGISKLLET
jgi:UDP-glucose 4-epimerase